MSTFNLIHGSCADQTADAVVNAANRYLAAGGGICGVIFSKCGHTELTQACSENATPVKDGDAVITPAFNMKNAKHIIHAVGPYFRQTPKAFLELFNAYYNSLIVLMNNNLHSISFPLISSSIFGGNLQNPAAESAKQCGRAYKKFIQDYPDYDVKVMLCGFTQSEYQAAKTELGVQNNMINLDELNKTWSNIIKYQDCKNDNQTINYIRAIQYGKTVIRDITPSDLLEIPVENVQMITKINELFNMIGDAQKKAFGDIIKQYVTVTDGLTRSYLLM